MSKADVARLGRPERLDRRARGLGLLIPEADQQVGAEADQSPSRRTAAGGWARAPGPSSRRRRATGRRSSGRARAPARRAGTRASRPEPARPRARPARASGARRRRRARPIAASERPAAGSHGMSTRTGSPDASTSCHARSAAAREPTANSSDRRPAVAPRRRSGETTASTRKAAAGSSSANPTKRVGVSHHPLSRSRWSAMTVRLVRKSRMTIARPSATSATVMAMAKSVKTIPTAWP